MEVDERLRWLESRISSSLRPRGEELRSLFSDEENRTAFLAFCNHSEARRLFVYLSSREEAGGEGGGITVSATPPRHLSDKALFFLKCSHASKLNRESIGHDVVYSECSTLPLEHLELVTREVYLPLISSHLQADSRVSGDKLMDLMHRLVGAVQVTKGFCDGKVVLPLPSIEVLAEAAMNLDRKAAVIHVLESSVVSWMKQVKIALLLDPNSTIIKMHGKYAGPLAETEFWSRRLSRLDSVRNQLSSVVVLNILHNLEQAHSTYAQAFIHVHRDIGKAIVDCEYYLMYLNTLQPWFLRLHHSFSPDSLMKLFPPTIKTLLLVWQHSRFYSTGAHFHRILHLLSNEAMLKARDIVGEDILDDPEMSLLNLKLALRVCAAFRGCYLDYKEKAESIVRSQREKREQLAHSEQEQYRDPERHKESTSTTTSNSIGHGVLCPWPPRNSPVFAPLNAIMERCNDLLDLVQTVHDFRELNLAEGDDQAQSGGGNPLIIDIYNNFTSCMSAFQHETQDLLSLETDCSFEEHFFHFRSSVKGFEKQLVVSLNEILDHTPSLQAKLRVLEMFQGVFKREAIMTSLKDRLDDIVSSLLSEVNSVSVSLSAHMATPPLLPHTPPVASKLLWLNALKERVSEPMTKVREVAPYLLEGDQGWRLRQVYAEVTTKIDEHAAQTKASWIHSVPPGVSKRLKGNVLVRSSSGHLEVNVDPSLVEVLSEISYVSRPPLGVRLPTALRQLVKTVNFKQLKHRKTSLEVVVESYNELQDSLSQVERLLFQHKLQETEKLIAVGVDNLDWMSANFPDFVAKTRAAVCGELQSTLLTVRQETQAIRSITASWSKAPGVGLFAEEGGDTKLTALQEKHRSLMESLQSLLPSSLDRINKHINQTFLCVHEASQKSPAWAAYLEQIDSLILAGLKNMLLSIISTLVQKATRYEQGDTIPPLVMVQLELQGGSVQYSPPLSGHSALSSVPEVVQKWMSDYISLTKLMQRVQAVQGGGREGEGEAEGVERDGGEEEDKTCFEAVSSEPDIKSAVGKICAHLETNSRQCQSLRKRFSMYSFLWEQDVGVTFTEFMRGQAAPHPRRFTRPETVRSRASARVHSGRPKSHTSSHSQLLTPAPEQSLFGVMGVSDWDFLCPPEEMDKSDGEEDDSKRPSLDDFDGEIAVFQGILDRLSNIEDVASVGWIQVDQRPAKQALTALAAKWKYTYASHLEGQITSVLSKLDQFFEEIEPEVEAISGEESDTQAFMKLMSIFNRVNSQQLEMDTKFGAVHRAVNMLDNFQFPLSSQLRAQFNNAPNRWTNLKKRVALGKQRIGPRIQAKGDVISQDLSRFGEMFTALKGRFETSECLKYDCPKHEAVSLIAEFSRELKELQSQARDLIELQELLETSVFNFSLLKKFEEELSTLQELWTISESIGKRHSSWHMQRWSEIDTSELTLETSQQLALLSTLPETVVEGWDLFRMTVEAVHVVQTSAPLMDGLRSPSMRPRHWKQVLRFAKGGPVHLLGRGGAFDPNVLHELTFGQLLEMGPHHHPDEIHAIVERANKDIAIESLLNTFEEVWLSRQLELRPHRRVADIARQETIPELGIDSTGPSSNTPKSIGPSARVTSAVKRRRASQSIGGRVSSLSTTPSGDNTSKPSVPLLYNTGGIFETLENHQLSLQSLEGTVAALSFTDDLHKWHKQLQTIEAVLSTWLKVQLLWMQLEEVYGSSEVQQHLPSHVFTFSNVDRDWRELMKTTSKNPAVISVCLKEDLLPSLEKLHSSLLQCQAALVRYVEGQRTKCPWFYFLPLEDILQFVCYGSSLEQLSIHIPKLLHYASGLVFDNVPAISSLSTERITPHATHSVRGGGSQVTGLVSVAGEKMTLNQGVVCEGPVEGIITQLFSSISSTLQSQLVNTIQNHILQDNSDSSHNPDNPFASLSHQLPLVWNSTQATQVITLATQIALDMCLNQALQGSESTKRLENFFEEMASLTSLAVASLKGKSLLEDDVTKSHTPDHSTSRDQENVTLGQESVTDIQKSSRAYHVPKSHTVKIENVIMLLTSFWHKMEGLKSILSSVRNISSSFHWQSLLHYEWSHHDGIAIISTLGTSLSYGYHYTGSAMRMVLTPVMERSLCFLLDAVKQGNSSLIVAKEETSRSSLVHELAVSAGQCVFSLQCSPQVSHDIILNCIKGIASTGSWLFLQSIDCLQPATLQTACTLLAELKEAQIDRKSSIQAMGESIHVSLDKCGVCFANPSYNWNSYLSDESSTLPVSLLESFKTCSVSKLDRKVVLEAFFLSNQFVNAAYLADSLDKFVSGFHELFQLNLAPFFPESDPTHYCNDILSVHLSLHRLKSIVALARNFMQEFDSIMVLGEETSGPVQQQGHLHMASIVFSEISHSTLNSFKYKSPFLPVSSADPSQQQTYQKQSLEEFSVILSLKDTVLSSFLSNSSEHSIVIKLISDIFPTCDLQGLLTHEANVKDGLEAKSREDKEAAESARESRAASAMQMVHDELPPGEVETSLEQQIVQSCQTQQLIPTQLFQTAVSQLVALVQHHQFVAVYGPTCSGKTAAIQTAVETLRQTAPFSKPGHITCTTIAVGAMREEQLLGFQAEKDGLWQDGILTNLLMKDSSHEASSLRGATRWVVLEGNMSTSQFESLLSYASPNSSITLSNGRSVQLSDSVRFILELEDLSHLDPASATEIGKVFLSSETIGWRDIIQRWLTTWSHDKSHDQSETLEGLFYKYIPLVIDFIRPALSGQISDTSDAVSSVNMSDKLSRDQIEPQDLRLSEVHLINTCCQILKSLVESGLNGGDGSSAVSLEHCLIYSVVWSFGGFLSHQNKLTFDQWWRNAFNQKNLSLCFPEPGLIWDYYTKPGVQGFLAWRDKTNVPKSLHSVKSSSPFVPNVRTAAVQNLINQLISRGVSVLLAGPQGSGKTSLLQQLLNEHNSLKANDTSLLHIYTNHFTSSEVVWGQMLECLEWNWGRRYTPKGCKKVVAFIDDLHNTECPSVCELVRHHLSSGSVCDPETNKWHSISDITYLVTADCSSHTKLQSSFVKHFAVIQWDQYSSDEMVEIFNTQLTTAAQHSHSSEVNLDPGEVLRLVETAVQVHRKLGTMFLATPERLHYVFSMNQISTLFKKLFSAVSSSPLQSHDLVLLWQRESWWMYSGSLSSELDRERYWEAVSHALSKYYNEDPMLPGYLQERSARLPIKSLEDWRTKLDHEVTEYNLLHSPIHVNLYDSAVEEIHHLCHVINSPFDHGHMMVLGHNHPECLVHLAALHCGSTLVKPSQYFSQSLLSSSSHCGLSLATYSVKQLRKDLLTIFTSAGVKNERMVILLTDKEILDESFLTCVYEFVKGGAISPLFSKEEQGKIVNAVRSDMTQAGVPFTRQAGWEFFIRRVHTNVRLVLTLSSLGESIKSGCHQWRQLFGSIQVYYYHPWERRHLVNVAAYHLRECEFLVEGQAESLAHLLASVHLQIRLREGVFASNTDYQYYVERFVHELSHMHSVNQSKCSKLSSALSCIERATSRINVLQERIKRESIVLEEKSEACVKLLVQIGQDTAISHEHNKLVKKQRERITHLKKVVPDFEHAYSMALQDKENLIESLRNVVANMDHQSLSELRSLQRAPPDVEELLVAVIVIMKGPTADFSWTKGAKRLMANLDRFSELLLEFSSCEDNSEVVLEALDPLIEKPTFSSDSYLKQPVGGKAASQLCSWVEGVHRLHAKLQATLRPLLSRVTSMRSALAEYSDKLCHQENKMSVLDDRLRGLSVSLENASVEKSRQHELVNKMKKEHSETQDFIRSLSGMHEQWKQEMENASSAVANRVGALCLSISMVTYLAPLRPHEQMEAINSQLVPLFEERGIKLYWKKGSSFANMFTQDSKDELRLSSPERGKDTAKTDSCTGELLLSPKQSPSSKQESSKDCSKRALSSSYTNCCASILSLLVEEQFLDKWLTSCCTSASVAFLMPCSLVHTAWNRWPLVCDQHGFALMWIKQYVGEDLVCLDGRDRSSTFFLGLEQAVVKGEKVLIEHFPSPMDPALQPLLEIGNSNNSAKVVHFCGHRLHVHSSFKLFMTTPSAPNSLSPSLASEVSLINFSPSLPLAEDILADILFNMATQSGDEFRETSKGVASCKAELLSLDKELFDKLPMNGKEDCYWWSTEKITNIVTKKNEIFKTMTDLTEKLNGYCSHRRWLIPLAKHTSLVYCILVQLEEANTLHSHSWEQFEELFKKMLDSFLKDHPSFNKDSADDAVYSTASDYLNCAILRHSIQYLDHSRWLLLASCMSLLTLSRSSLTNSLLLVEQLLYIAQGDSYLQELDVTLEDEHPPSPSCVPHELWQTLHKIPLSTEYFSVMIKSIHDDTKFWESLITPERAVDSCELPKFPWKKDSDGSNLSLQTTGPDEYVLLKCMCPHIVSDSLLTLANRLVDSVQIPELKEIVQNGDSSYPLLLLHDRESPVSQANVLELESELKNSLPGKSVHVVKMCAGAEDLVSPLLSQPKCDCLLIMNLDLASQEWLDLVTWRMKHTSLSGCLIVFTALNPSPGNPSPLPADLVRTCRTISLSKISFTSSRSLPRRLWMSNKRNDLFTLLALCLSSISPQTLAKCEALPESLRPLLFNLAVLHTATVTTTSSSSLTTTLEKPHLSLFLGCVEELLALTKHGEGLKLDPNVILKAITAHVCSIYSSCLTQGKVEKLVESCLSEEVVKPSARLRLGGVEVSVPSQAVSPRMFSDHVKGLMEAAGQDANDHLLRFADLAESIDSLLVPILTQIPSPELYTVPSPSDTPSSNHTPHWSHDKRAMLIKATLETIDNCRDQLPGMVKVGDDAAMDSMKERLSRVMVTCSNLSSSKDCLEHKMEKVVSEFNSVISSIGSDLSTLAHFATVGFDGLPSSLQPVLTSIQNNKMPVKWTKFTPGSNHATLKEGLEALRRLHSHLSLKNTNKQIPLSPNNLKFY